MNIEYPGLTGATEVKWDATPKGVQLTLAKPNDGPVVIIEGDGTIDVKKGPYDEAGRMFWDAVRVAGITYQERIEQLNQMVAALSLDPYRDAVTHRGFDVHSELSKSNRKRLTFVDVSAVLEAIHKIASKEMQ